ncbi:MAG: methyl-accepting chemotaxis protein [Microscillaceae bacterium]|nr:methyl-accepting chemotaxis protein [Microscillaceae bacterium]MDW8460573.1 methyl-accepting chemotaxis protein [Cytophagales bacterium]
MYFHIVKLLHNILKNFRSLKAKLLFSFFIFLFLTCLIVVITFWFETRQDMVEKVANRFITTSLQLQFMRKLEADFFVEDAINTTFFETGLSQTLSQRKKLVEKIEEDFNFLLSSKEIENFGVAKELIILRQIIEAYQKKFEEIVQNVRKKGFKGYGLEGTMRKAIHQLEEYKPVINLAQVLMLRRHEKDFIIRKEKSYLQKHAQVVSKLLKEIEQQNLPPPIKEEQTKILIEYANTFQKFAEIDIKIGVSHKYGLKKELSDLSQLIDKQNNAIREKIESQIKILPRQIFTTLLVILIIYITIISFLAFYITKALSQPISELSKSIHQVIESNFSDEVEFKNIRTNDEIGKLSKDFFFMYSKVKSSLQEIREKMKKLSENNVSLWMDFGMLKKCSQLFYPISTS